jgi:hypothetical protein
VTGSGGLNAYLNLHIETIVQILIQLLCGIVSFGATIWIISATPTTTNLAGAALGGAIGYGLSWLALRGFPKKSAPDSSIHAGSSHS